MFETNRLILRSYSYNSNYGDEAFFTNLFNTYDVLVNLTSEYITPNIDTHRERLEKMIKCALFVVVVDKKARDKIGFALVNITAPKNLDGEVGMALVKEYWGKGYGTEIMEWLIGYSFRGLGLRRLSLFTFSSNTRAIALYEKVYVVYPCKYESQIFDFKPIGSPSGFKHEGRKREAQWKEGEWVDIVWMGILSREYTAPGHALQDGA